MAASGSCDGGSEDSETPWFHRDMSRSELVTLVQSGPPGCYAVGGEMKVHFVPIPYLLYVCASVAYRREPFLSVYCS